MIIIGIAQEKEKLLENGKVDLGEVEITNILTAFNCNRQTKTLTPRTIFKQAYYIPFKGQIQLCDTYMDWFVAVKVVPENAYIVGAIKNNRRIDLE